MAKKYTVEQFRARLEEIASPRKLSRAITPPFRKGVKIMQAALAAEYWSSRFGARIWLWQRNVKGDKKGGPSIKRGKSRQVVRWSNSNQAYVGKLFVRGLAKKIEEGGRLRRHVPYGREKLAYSPGLNVPTRPIFDRLIEGKLWPITLGYIEKDFEKYVQRNL